MSSNWPTVKLGDYCKKIGSGATPRGGASVYMDEGEICLIRSQNVYNEGFNPNGLVYIDEEAAKKLKNVTVEENDVLLNITGDSVARVCLAKSNFLPARVNQHVAIIRPDEKEFDSRFIRYLLASPVYQNILLSIAAVGATRNALTKGMIENLDVVKPPIDQQIEIADKLEALEKKIDINSETNQTLEQIAQALFKSWFVDFDPVKAKIAVLEAGGTTEEAELAAMSMIAAKSTEQLAELKQSKPDAYEQLAQTAALFPSAMQESELGEIPEGWNATPFGELLEKTIGGDWGKEALDEKHTEKVRILRGTDLPNVHSGNDSGVPVRYVNKKKLQTRQLQDGDIVIEVSGGSPTQPTGRSLFISQKILDGFKEPVEPASFCRLFRPLNVKLGLLLSCHLTKIYSDGKTWIYQNQSTGISNFQTKVFLEKELVVVPDAGVLDAFIHNMRPFIDRIHSGESKKLSALRDTLLPELLSGNCPISTVEEV